MKFELRAGLTAPNPMQDKIHFGEGFIDPTLPDANAPLAFPRPNASQLASLPASAFTRGFDQYSRQVLGRDCPPINPGMMSPQTLLAFENYRRVVHAFDAARLSFLVALYGDREQHRSQGDNR